jgi:hypothetical protein
VKTFDVIRQDDFMELDFENIRLPGIWILLYQQHWYLVHLFHDRKGRILANLFDSYANNPIEKYNLSIPGVYKVRHNEGVLQSNNSLLCGVFCLYTAYFLSRGYSFPQLSKRFSLDTLRNEKKWSHSTESLVTLEGKNPTLYFAVLERKMDCKYNKYWCQKLVIL